jgi:hypothetical protein
MLQFYAQTATPTPSVVPSVTPTTSTEISGYVQQVVTSLLGIDIMFVLRVVLVWLFIIWMVFALWVAMDAIQRYKNPVFGILWFIFVAPFNFLGLIGYLFIRPTLTMEEKEWTKLEGKYLMHELSNINDCPRCKTMVPTSSNYCVVCGYQMNTTCEKCEYVQSVFNNYCLSCGKKLRDDVQETPAVPEVLVTQSTKTVVETPISTVNGSPTIAQTVTTVSSQLSTAMNGFVSGVQKMFEKKKAASRLETAVTEEKGEVKDTTETKVPEKEVKEEKVTVEQKDQPKDNKKTQQNNYSHNHNKHHKKKR